MDIYYTLEEKYLHAVEEQVYGNPAKALQMQNEILAADPDYARSLYRLGQIHFHYTHDYNAAGYYLGRCIALEPSFPDSYLPYLELLVFLQREKMANDIAEKALAVPGVNKAAVNGQLALLAESSREFKRAVSLYREAILCSTNDGETEFLNSALERVKQKLGMEVNFRYISG